MTFWPNPFNTSGAKTINFNLSDPYIELRIRHGGVSGRTTFTIDNLELATLVATQTKHYLADVIQYNDYFPFGMSMAPRSGMAADEGYRYGFQGQEMDDEIKGEGNSVNYKYRMHDPRIGRFFAIDPLAAKYPHYSTYSFSGNKVIHRVEIEGLEDGRIQTHSGDLGIRRLNKARIDHISKEEYIEIHNMKGLAVAAVTGLVASYLSPVPGDELIVTNLLIRTFSATVDAASQVGAGGDFDLTGPVLSFVTMKPFAKEGIDAMVDFNFKNGLRTPFYSSNFENNNKRSSETMIDFGFGAGKAFGLKRLPRQISRAPMGRVVPEAFGTGFQNFGSELIKSSFNNGKEEDNHLSPPPSIRQDNTKIEIHQIDTDELMENP